MGGWMHQGLAIFTVASFVAIALMLERLASTPRLIEERDIESEVYVVMARRRARAARQARRSHSAPDDAS